MTSSYTSLLSRRGEILRRSTGIDYRQFTDGPLLLDFEALMASAQYTPQEVRELQWQSGVGQTPLLELTNLTRMVRRWAPDGCGARIFVKDEASNASGSFKDRRAALSAHHARLLGYRGIVAATSGNYGAAVASQAARHGLRAVVIQEAYDSQWRGQPEILEKARKCEALGAEVIQTTVGPELFYVLLQVLEQTGFFNASLYTPFSVRGIETLGEEIAQEVRAVTGRDAAAVLATHAGGGMCTGVGRGLRRAGANSTRLVAVSVDLHGLHMASDADFNRKSFTTGHTGFSVPFTSWPDRVDVPRNAARSLRYIDRFITVTQGSVFYATELLAQCEGLERGPAGNVSLAAALVLARELPKDEGVVISETEYTGAGKSPWAQLEFAERMGVEVTVGAELPDQPGQRIVLPTSLEQVDVTELDLASLRQRYVRGARDALGRDLDDAELAFLAEDTRAAPADVGKWLEPDG